jgi:hypothetical protein
VSRANLHAKLGPIGKNAYANRRVDVFLNIPYDRNFEKLYLAYIAGLSAFGLYPRATLEIPTSIRRLDRILKLIHSCPYSLHDMSRIELDRTRPSTPRFNMPFELGLSVSWQRTKDKRHAWYVLESDAYRFSKSLGDLNGTDVHVHDGKIAGVFSALGNIFVREKRRPTVTQMRRIYSSVKKNLPLILRDAGARSPFEARAFSDLRVLARESANRYVG